MPSQKRKPLTAKERLIKSNIRKLDNAHAKRAELQRQFDEQVSVVQKKIDEANEVLEALGASEAVRR